MKQYSLMALLERWYPGLDRAFRFCGALGWVGVQALGLGLLDADELVRLTLRRFDSSTFLNPTYNGSSGMWLWEREALRRFFPPSGRILVGAAGSGREMIALHRAGYEVEGFECAPALVAAGKAILLDAGCSGSLILAPPSVVPEMPGRFDAAIMGWSGYMYIPRRAQRVQLLRDFRQLLVEGGPLLLSFQTRELCERRMRWSARAANWLRRIRGAEPVAPGDYLDAGFKHWFNRQDIADEMAEAGFRLECYVVDGYGWAVGRNSAQPAVAGDADPSLSTSQLRQP